MCRGQGGSRRRRAGAGAAAHIVHAALDALVQRLHARQRLRRRRAAAERAAQLADARDAAVARNAAREAGAVAARDAVARATEAEVVGVRVDRVRVRVLGGVAAAAAVRGAGCCLLVGALHEL